MSKLLLSKFCVFFTFIPCVVFCEITSWAQSPSYTPKIAPASNEGRLAINGFQLLGGVQAELVAAEPLMANPVVFCIDEHGRFYVAESFRQLKGIEDNRDHMDWLHDDLALQSVEDRLEMFQKFLGDKVSSYGVEHDRIRLLEDTDGDGQVDKSTVFADGFNGILEGTGAGLLARRGNVYFTCIPKLWKLRDDDGDGVAEHRDGLHHGYGVRVAFRGHDLHGLTFGPDGRLYFSIGDRGYNVVTKEGKHLKRPDTGAVFRCEPDGSNLEVFAYGLRNPQELAFDDYGNLFTGDNNSDSGDQARWVYVVEGSDTGWRMNFQYLPDRGPWNRERMWYPYRSDEETARVQPAFIVPPIINLADGPSGLVYYPGVGLSERYKGHFFMCDFRGMTGISGIRSFAVKPKGATFELVDSHKFVWSIMGTDVDFGYDGSLYVSDWVEGWNGIGKGRLYRFTDSQHAQDAAAVHTAKLMREGFMHRPVEELAKLLTHPDRRIRQEAQFTLAEKQAVDALSAVLRDREHLLSRLHAVWGLGQIGRFGTQQATQVSKILLSIAENNELEVRAQIARVLGDLPHADSVAAGRIDGGEVLTTLLDDKSLRVQSLAAISLGKRKHKAAWEPLVAMLHKNDNADPVIRHAAVMGLTGIAGDDSSRLASLASHGSSAVRTGAVLVMRRLKHRGIQRFLQDSERSVATEAARAIHDEPLKESMPALASLPLRENMPDALLRRVLSANFALGKPQHARNIARIAANTNVSEAVRAEAVEELKLWDAPPPLDRVLGSWQPIPPRSLQVAAPAVRDVIKQLLDAPDAVREAAIPLTAQYELRGMASRLSELLAETESSTGVRREALRALDALNDSRLPETVSAALNDQEASIRSEARRVLARIHPEQAVRELASALQSGEPVEQQAAVDVLASMKTTAADRELASWMDRLIAGQVAAEIQLDVIEAARSRGTTLLKRKLTEFEASRAADDPLAQYRECLSGGNVQRGRDIFVNHTAVACMRCHKIRGFGGAVGPELTKIGSEKQRDYLLESLILPSKQIAKDFDSVVLAMESGKVHAGVLKTDDGTHLHLMTAEGTAIIVPKNEIEARAAGKSAMPDDVVKQLTKSQIRDLVEFLVSLKGGGA